ncbi:MAG: hypothetical protein Q9162_002821 [Coniocarpon cinnabarinum]
MPLWQDIATQKQAQRDALLPKEWRLAELPGPDVLDVTSIPARSGILNADEVAITENFDAVALAELIRKRKLSAYAVTLAFCKRAAIAQQLTNCLTEICFTSALNRAKALDHHLERYGEPVGPLHGVPISLKDGFRLPNFDATIGFAAFANKPSTFPSPLVTILLEAGAVFYCKTNVPQTLMALDSENNVWGRTLNPLNRKVTAGGSSGGEGALLGIKGSVLGVGTDIGGSIRIPSYCNGIYGIMPSANRVPYTGQAEPGAPGGSHIGLKSRAGPMARSLRDCELFLRTVAASRPWLRDSNIIPGYWDAMEVLGDNGTPAQAPAPSRGLTFGVLMTDNLMTPLPPIRNLLLEVKEKLERAGHAVHVLSTPPMFAKLQSLSNANLAINGSEHGFKIMAETGEPQSTWLASRVKSKPPKSIEEAREILFKTEQVSTELLKQLWSASTPQGKQEVDAIICPVAPHPVAGIDKWGGVSYTIDWVLLDCCGGHVPVRKFTHEDAKLEFNENEKEILGPWDRYNRGLWDQSEREVYLGSPLGVQVVAPKLQEKRLYRAMDAVDKAVRGEKWTGSVEQQAADTMAGMGGAKL